MRLADFLLDDSLNALRASMRAPLSQFQVSIQLPKPEFPPRFEPQELDPIPEGGIEVWDSEIGVHSDGTLTYASRRVLLHIRDAMKWEPRFHLANCITLQEMRHNGRFEKYVVCDGEDGYFQITLDGGPLARTKLAVCQNCLDYLSWKGFSREAMSSSARANKVKEFVIKEFFAKYPRALHPLVPKHTALTAPDNEYPTNWVSISSELRRQLGYSCQNCGLVVGEKLKKFLHVHHKNGLKNDCSLGNLACLCIGCHATMPNHENVANSPEYMEFREIFK